MYTVNIPSSTVPQCAALNGTRWPTSATPTKHSVCFAVPLVCRLLAYVILRACGLQRAFDCTHHTRSGESVDDFHLSCHTAGGGGGAAGGDVGGGAGSAAYFVRLMSCVAVS
jgi:hypothetical protein